MFSRFKNLTIEHFHFKFIKYLCINQIGTKQFHSKNIFCNIFVATQFARSIPWVKPPNYLIFNTYYLLNTLKII